MAPNTRTRAAIVACGRRAHRRPPRRGGTGRRNGSARHSGRPDGECSRGRATLEAEDADRLCQCLRLLLQAFRRCRSLLDQGGILLCHGIHLPDCLVHFADAAALLLAGAGNFAHDAGHLVNRSDDALHGIASRIDQAAAFFDTRYRGPDQFLDFLGRRRAALRQVAHFRRHHRKAAPLLARPRCLDCRIQRQDIGLECDAVDHADDVVDAR